MPVAVLPVPKDINNKAKDSLANGGGSSGHNEGGGRLAYQPSKAAGMQPSDSVWGLANKSKPTANGTEGTAKPFLNSSTNNMLSANLLSNLYGSSKQQQPQQGLQQQQSVAVPPLNLAKARALAGENGPILGSSTTRAPLASSAATAGITTTAGQATAASHAFGGAAPGGGMGFLSERAAQHAQHGSGLAPQQAQRIQEQQLQGQQQLLMRQQLRQQQQQLLLLQAQKAADSARRAPPSSSSSSYSVGGRVFFVGRSGAKKIKGNPHTSRSNFGYDDDRGDYNVVLHDHLGYRYEVLGILGKGSFGQVLKCHDFRTNTLRAVKVIRNKKRFHHQALVELQVLQYLRDMDPKNETNCVQITDHFVFRSHLCISFELLSINLYDFIKHNNFCGLSMGLIRRFGHQILVSLQFLKSLRIIHCDLKPENILLCQPNRSAVKVIDFGSSCFKDERVYTYIQSRFYRSPEIILGLPYGCEIDMWSFGCILAELCTGCPLFPGEDEAEQLACIMEVLGVPPADLLAASSRRKLFFDSNNVPRPTVNSQNRTRIPGATNLRAVLKCPDAGFLDLLEKCLRWDPAARLTPDQALHHPWVMGNAAAAAHKPQPPSSPPPAAGGSSHHHLTASQRVRQSGLQDGSATSGTAAEAKQSQPAAAASGNASAAPSGSTSTPAAMPTSNGSGAHQDHAASEDTLPHPPQHHHHHHHHPQHHQYREPPSHARWIPPLSEQQLQEAMQYQQQLRERHQQQLKQLELTGALPATSRTSMSGTGSSSGAMGGGRGSSGSGAACPSSAPYAVPLAAAGAPAELTPHSRAALTHAPHPPSHPPPGSMHPANGSASIPAPPSHHHHPRSLEMSVRRSLLGSQPTPVTDPPHASGSGGSISESGGVVMGGSGRSIPSSGVGMGGVTGSSMVIPAHSAVTPNSSPGTHHHHQPHPPLAHRGSHRGPSEAITPAAHQHHVTHTPGGSLQGSVSAGGGAAASAAGLSPEASGAMQPDSAPVAAGGAGVGGGGGAVGGRVSLAGGSERLRQSRGSVAASVAATMAGGAGGSQPPAAAGGDALSGWQGVGGGSMGGSAGGTGSGFLRGGIVEQGGGTGAGVGGGGSGLLRHAKALGPAVKPLNLTGLQGIAATSAGNPPAFSRHAHSHFHGSLKDQASKPASGVASPASSGNFGSGLLQTPRALKSSLPPPLSSRHAPGTPLSLTIAASHEKGTPWLETGGGEDASSSTASSTSSSHQPQPQHTKSLPHEVGTTRGGTHSNHPSRFLPHLASMHTPRRMPPSPYFAN
ncbi:hypothetical protein DUNSADRAFT_12329 [Dunaliella salina]|uniref:Protein kinase domain-containing protein n=1 Tax=Dunaliella salina TaxID=3046 RepID=A0ABQ7GBH3_DUNSA|nr:hypothetical protein DUNSADRAFT_12329 [Dunaliella salina]|eukprot:KAF5831964.1 hypothetical protein DUNSADRAFT_12329 [Dunaliella salina]